MRRISPAGDCGAISGDGSAGGGGLSLPVILSEVNGPLPLWLASVDIGLNRWSAPARLERGTPETDNSTRKLSRPRKGTKSTNHFVTLPPFRGEILLP